MIQLLPSLLMEKEPGTQHWGRKNKIFFRAPHQYRPFTNSAFSVTGVGTDIILFQISLQALSDAAPAPAQPALPTAPLVLQKQSLQTRAPQ